MAGLTGQPSYFSLGTKYIGTTFDFSLLGVIQKNGDFSQSSYLDPALGVMRSTMVFDAKGIEVLGNISLINFLFLQDTIYMFLI
jgi:hypothetical protein